MKNTFIPKPSPIRAWVDLDDFCEGNQSWEQLECIKRQVPGFRVTLFSILGRCSQRFLQWSRSWPWIDLVPHGWMHRDCYECAAWTYEEMIRYLDRIEPLRLTRGFKAPGWQISDAAYVALQDRGYWVADQEYNEHRWPTGLKVYLLDDPNKIHGHIGHLGGFNQNELGLITDRIVAHRNFGFIKDLVSSP